MRYNITEEEKIKFFNQVKGKAIRWTGWVGGRYFIPETFENKNGLAKMCGRTYNNGNNYGETTKWQIVKGFEEWSHSRYHWEIIDNPIKIKTLVNIKMKKLC